MELFGIAVSIPIAFAGSMLYSLLLAKIVRRYAVFSRVLRTASYVVLVFFIIEIALLITVGAIRSRDILGPSFYNAHFILFFITTPALANALLLREKEGFVSPWVAGALCTMLAFCLVLLQYGVSEALYGIE
jgi:hypothetical protein